MSDRSFTIPRVRLHLADGSSADVGIRNTDRLQWDLTAPKKKWGLASEVPHLAQTFIAFCAAKREGATVLSWDAFQEALVGMQDLEDDVVIRPTPPAASGASS